MQQLTRTSFADRISVHRLHWGSPTIHRGPQTTATRNERGQGDERQGDIDGPYTSELYNEEGEFVGHSPEWRGLLKEDYTLEGILSRSFRIGLYRGIRSAGYNIWIWGRSARQYEEPFINFGRAF